MDTLTNSRPVPDLIGYAPAAMPARLATAAADRPCDPTLFRLTARLDEVDIGDGNAESVIGSLSAAIDALAGMHDARRRLLHAAIADGDSLRTQLTQLGGVVADMDAQILAGTKDAADLRAAIAIHERTNAELRDDLRLLKVERDSLKLAHGNATADVAHYKSLAEDADRTAARLTAEANQAKARITELEGLLTEAQEARDKAEDERKATAEALKDIRTQRDATQKEAADLRKRLARPGNGKVPAAPRKAA